MKTRTYSELCRLPTFEERLEYLRLYGTIGSETFGHDDIFRRKFLLSKEWRDTRRRIILRDNACDLGVPGREIENGEKIFIHHMVPINMEDLRTSSDFLLLDEYMITTSFNTHNIIHYGTGKSSDFSIIERTPWDTCPWKHQTKEDLNEHIR